VASAKKVLNNFIKRAEKQATKDYTNYLRKYANASGWPDGLTSRLNMSHVDDSHIITFPHELADQIRTLEYGTESIPPSPVLRTFMIDQTRK
jgi:hypothetical protein